MNRCHLTTNKLRKGMEVLLPSLFGASGTVVPTCRLITTTRLLCRTWVHEARKCNVGRMLSVSCQGASQTTDPVVSTAWLHQHLNEACILDIRGIVETTKGTEDGTDASKYLDCYTEYLEGHIPGAVFFNWVKDALESSTIPVQLMTDSERFSAVMEAKGVSTDKPVVVYDRGDGLLAPRLWWSLVRHGHPDVRVLDGGYRKWEEEGRETELYEPCTLKIFADYDASAARPSLVATWEEVMQCIPPHPNTHLSEAPVLVDARDTSQHRGLTRRAVRGGRIPGSVSIPRRELLHSNGTFKSAPEQREVFLKAGLDPTSPRKLIAYCNGGVASCSVLLAWHRIGGKGEAANYDGSWNEWGNRLDLPIETTMA